MKERKRTTAFFLSIILVLSLLPVEAWAGGYRLTLTDGGESTVLDDLSYYMLPKYPDDTKGDEVLEGWSTLPPGDPGEPTVYGPEAAIRLTSDVQLYAKWTPKKDAYTVSLDPNGGTGSKYTAEKGSGTVYEIPDAQSLGFSKNQNTFIGWSLTDTGAPDLFPGDNVIIDRPLTLFAVWKETKSYSPIGDIRPVMKGYIHLGGRRWTVVGESNDAWFLVLDGTLDGLTMNWSRAQAYCYDKKPEISSLSDVDPLYCGFSEAEKKAVSKTTKTDDKAFSNYARANLDEKNLFQLSAAESQTYFNEEWLTGTWWLRSFTNNGMYVVIVDGKSLGTIYPETLSKCGVRPAMVLDRSAVLFTSATSGNRSLSRTPGGGFEPYDDGFSGRCERKLTLIDDSRKEFKALPASSEGRNILIRYMSAGRDDNDHVSALICDPGDNILYYASRSTGGSENGLFNLTVPELPDGPYTLKVFSEQINGDEFSNQASPVNEIKLTMEDGAVVLARGSGNNGEDNPPVDDVVTPVDLVPSIGDEKPASSADNFAPLPGEGKINKMKLDFSNVLKSDVKPEDLRMTVIKGSKLTTVAKVAEGGTVTASGGVKVKVSRKTGTATITCKDTGSATLPMEDGVTYTLNFTVDKPKAVKTAIPVGSEPQIKTIKELFNTGIDSGKLSAVSKKNASKATVSGDNTLVISPEGKDTIKVSYIYMNKKYKLNIKVR